MRMSRVEKGLVNRGNKGAANTERVRVALESMGEWSGRDVLELGAGIADVSAFLAGSAGFTAVATDVDPEQVALANRRHEGTPRLTCRVEDATRLSFPDASFDLVVAQNVFHHIPRWDLAVREIARVLRPGGRVVWLDLVAPAWLRPALEPLRARMGIYDREEIRGAFEKAGLSIRSASSVFHGIAMHDELVLERVDGQVAGVDGQVADVG